MAYLPSTTISDIYAALKQIINALVRPMFLDPTTGRLNVNTVTTVTTCATITTCSTVTNLAQVGGFNAELSLVFPTERGNWAHSVRARIT